MFIVILLFFFSNVYLWHDAATKEMNQLYVDRLNTPITVSIIDSTHLNVTNRGGSDTKLSLVWIVIGSSDGTGPDLSHTSIAHTELIPAGKSISIQIPNNSGQITYKVITANGNTASCSNF